MAIQTTLSFEDPKLVEYMGMYEAMKEASEADPYINDYGNATNRYREDIGRIYELYSSGLQLKDVTVRLYDPMCFNYLELSYKQYILKVGV